MSVDPFEYLLSLEQFGIKFGLDNIQAIVAALGHPERTFASIHIAGTNGKGSVTAMVDAILRAAGHRSARYTSPHLVGLAERFVVDGEPVAHADLKDAIATVRDAVSALQARQVLDVHPTFFEVTTAVAFELFRRAGVTVAACEVGLGGRLDATNVLIPMTTAITSIALDHQQYLGTTVHEIAAEKAGIIKTGVPVITGDLEPSAASVVAAIAQRLDAPVIRAHDGVRIEIVSTTGPSQVRLQTPTRDYGVVEIALGGTHQIANAVVAVRIAEEIDVRGLAISGEAIAEGLRSVRWRGRLERMTFPDGRDVLLDAAHNPAGAATLARFLAAEGAKRPLVFAAMRDKDIRGILEALAPAVSMVVATRASHPRSAEPQAVAELIHAIAPHLGTIVEPSPAQAMDAAWRQSRAIVVAGSIFLLGDVMKALGRS